MKAFLRAALAALTVAVLALLASCGQTHRNPVFTIDEDGNLIVEYENGDKQMLGNVREDEDTGEQSSEKNIVDAELNAAGIPSVSVPPGSCMVMDDRSLVMDRQEVILRFIEKGIVPVMFGDVVMDRALGFAILSGDQIMERLAEFIDFEKVIFVSDIDGLYDCDPKSNRDAALYETVTMETLECVDAGSSVDDVTGGVAEKMRWMLRMSGQGRECVLINGNVPGRLRSALIGEETVCTRAVGGLS